MFIGIKNIAMSEFYPKSNYQIVSAKGSAQSTPTNNPNFSPLLIYGGVAVAVIIALTYYNQVLLKSISKLISTKRKK